MATPQRTLTWLGGLGMWGLMFLAMTPLGCGNTIERIPLRYRETTEGPRLPDITVERLQACFEEHKGQLGDQSYRIESKVKVNSGGYAVDAETTGLPEHEAPEFSSCTRIALSNMKVPLSIFPLRTLEALGTANSVDKPLGNQAGNVLIVVGIATVLAEFVIEYGGHMILFAVSVALVEDAIEAAKRRRRTSKDECTDGFEECMDSKIGDLLGEHWNRSRCGSCLKVCRMTQSWPAQVPMFDRDGTGKDVVPCGRLGPTWSN